MKLDWNYAVRLYARPAAARYNYRARFDFPGAVMFTGFARVRLYRRSRYTGVVCRADYARRVPASVYILIYTGPLAFGSEFSLFRVRQMYRRVSRFPRPCPRISDKYIGFFMC